MLTHATPGYTPVKIPTLDGGSVDAQANIERESVVLLLARDDIRLGEELSLTDARRLMYRLSAAVARARELALNREHGEVEVQAA